MKAVNSLFDIIGPIMIGPSSSHTAGAAKLAKIAGSFAKNGIEYVTFYLHGSFQNTYVGHGSDRALLAGLMGLDPHDTGLRDAYRLADEKGIKYEFVKKDLGFVHPNTIKFEIREKNGETVSVVGSSLGGGEVIITNVNGFDVRFDGNLYTFVTRHDDVPGVVAAVTDILANNGINIADMSLSRTHRGGQASMIVETDAAPSEEAVAQMETLPFIRELMCIAPVKVGEIDV